ncbi:MAG: hypothetical protein WC069_06635 [Candidatus Shapirobacteria bacterium]
MEELILVILIGFIVVNGLSYWSKYILGKNGYPVSWFRHYQDIPNMFSLARETKELSKKRIYYIIGAGIPIGMIITFALFITVLPKPNQNLPCIYQEKFRQTEWSGIVIKKYMDSLHYNAKRIEIQNNNEVKKIRNNMFFANGNFEKIEVGDSIVKQLGEINIKLFKRDHETVLPVDYGCDK